MTETTANTQRTCIGLFGGTFDPIHIGHLRISLELKQALALDEMRMVPCHIPPHRGATQATAEQRAAMVKLAIKECDEFEFEALELRNPEPSYSVHTLEELRKQLGEEVSLCLAMGMDSLITMSSWYRWRDILELAHIIVAARPGWEIPTSGEMADYLQQHQGQAMDLKKRSRGCIVVQALTLLPIASTHIRELVAQGKSARYLVTDSVWDFIQQNKLYGNS